MIKVIKIIVSFRLTPSYGFIILFYLYLMPLIGKGPMWSTVTVNTLAKPCDDYWWTNLLYINNFYPTKLGQEVISIKLFTNNNPLVSCLISLSLSLSLSLSHCAFGLQLYHCSPCAILQISFVKFFHPLRSLLNISHFLPNISQNFLNFVNHCFLVHWVGLVFGE